MKPEEVELLAQGQVEQRQDLKRRQMGEFRASCTFSHLKGSSYHQKGDVAEGHSGGQQDGQRFIHPLSRAVVDAPVWWTNTYDQQACSPGTRNPPRTCPTDPSHGQAQEGPTHQLNSLKSFCATNQK